MMNFYWDKQYDKAFTIFEALSKQNHAGAQNCLGICYERGWGAERNEAKALEWYGKSAAQGYAKAFCNLGKYYEQEATWKYAGTKFKEKEHEEDANYKKALELMDKAIQLGDEANACWYLSMYYEGGNTAKKDMAKSFEYAKRGAELGNAELQLKVGHYYEEGKGVKKDYAKAAQWFQKALDNGDERGKSFLDDLRKKKKI